MWGVVIDMGRLDLLDTIKMVRFSLTLNFIVVVVVQPLLYGTVNSVQSQETDLYMTPSINALYEGEPAVFNCTTTTFKTLQWTLNGNFVNSIQDLGETIEINDTESLVWSVLTIPARLMYNDSMVTCHGQILFTSLYEWRDSKFLVQGVPDKVENFQGNRTSATRLMFSWTPPSHIQGIAPCCNNYSINITNIDSGDIVFNNHITRDTFIEFDTSSSSNHVCSLYQIQISAFNDLGEGEIMDTRWSLGGFFEANEATDELFYANNDVNDDTIELMLGVSVTIGGLCLNMLDNMTLIVECNSVSQSLQQTKDIQAESADMDIQRYIEVMIPDSHKDRTCTYDVALENRVDLSKKTFRTHDTQSVSLSNVPGMVCISCSYIRDSPGKGCVLTAVQTGINRAIEFSTNIPLADDRGCLYNLTQGRYNIRVFDWQPNGGRSEETVFTSVIDVIPTSVTPSPTVSSSTDTNVGGIVGGVVVAFIVAIGLIVGIFIAIICVVRRSSNRNEDVTKGGVAADGAQGPKIELNSGESVPEYDWLKSELAKILENWDYDKKTVKIDVRNEKNYRYVLISQDLK